MEQLPVYSSDLIDLLNSMYPPRCIQETDNEISAHRYAAKRQLVEELIDLRSFTEENEFQT